MLYNVLPEVGIVIKSWTFRLSGYGFTCSPLGGTSMLLEVFVVVVALSLSTGVLL